MQSVVYAPKTPLDKVFGGDKSYNRRHDTMNCNIMWGKH